MWGSYLGKMAVGFCTGRNGCGVLIRAKWLWGFVLDEMDVGFLLGENGCGVCTGRNGCGVLTGGTRMWVSYWTKWMWRILIKRMGD